MRTFFLLATTAALAACTTHLGGDTGGDHGNGTFSYSSCFAGCTTTTPMMLNDEETVSVTGAIPKNVSVASSAPSIVSVKSASRVCCSNENAGECRTIDANGACDADETASLSITVDAPSAGSSELWIRNAEDDSVWDSVTLSVEVAKTLSLTCGPTDVVVLPNGSSCNLTWKATDASGNGLMSTAGIQLTSDNAFVAAFDGFMQVDQSSIVATPQILGDVSIHATGPGAAVVRGTGGGVSEALVVNVK